VLDAPAGTVLTDAPATEVRMRAYAGAEVEASIAAGTPFDKAGGYAIQDEAFAPVAAIAGCYCNVVGLPLWSLRALLARLRPALVLDRPDRTRPVCTGCPLRGPDA
jgi:septum formation protein